MRNKTKRPATQLDVLGDIRVILSVIMCLCALIAGSSCDVAETAEVIMWMVEEQDEAEADRAMAGGSWI